MPSAVKLPASAPDFGAEAEAEADAEVEEPTKRVCLAMVEIAVFRSVATLPTALEMPLIEEPMVSVLLPLAVRVKDTPVSALLILLLVLVTGTPLIVRLA